MRKGFLERDKYRLILDALTEEIKPVFVVAYHFGMRADEIEWTIRSQDILR